MLIIIYIYIYVYNLQVRIDIANEKDGLAHKNDERNFLSHLLDLIKSLDSISI